ncbi:MAG: hypothetical protein AAF517_02290 [Planctomycetota bacterium]
MNYLAHGLGAFDRPYELAGTALPDWLRVHGVRLKAEFEALECSGDECAIDLRRGTLRHLEQDRAFHQAEVFQRLSQRTSRRMREVVSDPYFRASFFAHVICELLLDAEIERVQPGTVDRYYGALEGVDPLIVERTVEGWTTAPPSGLADSIRRFREIRFLADYGDDERLVHRVDRVAGFVGLAPLPRRIVPLVSEVRREVRKLRERLLCPETSV